MRRKFSSNCNDCAGDRDPRKYRQGTWARKLPETEVVEIGGISIYVLHDLAQLDLKPEAAGFGCDLRPQPRSEAGDDATACFISIPAARGRGGSSCR